MHSICRLLLATGMLFGSASACSLVAEELTPEQFVSQYGGDLATYRELALERDCDRLANESARGQNNFEDTELNQWKGHQRAAHQRFEELDCVVD